MKNSTWKRFESTEKSSLWKKSALNRYFQNKTSWNINATKLSPKNSSNRRKLNKQSSSWMEHSTEQRWKIGFPNQISKAQEWKLLKNSTLQKKLPFEKWEKKQRANVRLFLTICTSSDSERCTRTPKLSARSTFKILLRPICAEIWLQLSWRKNWR